jgi:hypothetical protein
MVWRPTVMDNIRAFESKELEKDVISDTPAVPNMRSLRIVV